MIAKQHEFRVENNQGRPLVHNLESAPYAKLSLYLSGFLIIILGVVSGYSLSHNKSVNRTDNGLSTGSTSKTVVGSKDSQTFRDSAQGMLEAGGINGEGTHKLQRPGGESQTVVLTSSVLDLSKFEGKKVKVWGETFAGQSSGWFMDVGKVELVQ